VHHSHEDGAHYDRFDCPIYAAFRDGLVRNVGDEVFWRKDGSSFPVEYTSTPIYNSGEIVGSVVVFRDITMRRQTEERLRSALLEVRELKERLQAENRALRKRIGNVHFPNILGSSQSLKLALELLCRAATTDSTVLLQGETGTGKELFARALHEASGRNKQPLIRLNCGAISRELVESELFGHERGAFTGAERRRIGRFEQANGGTLFLDEVGEMPISAQVKLLRVLQEREFERVGGNDTIRVDVRVIAAKNRDLSEMVSDGTFRMDLFYRLNVVPISVPALRQRLSDLPLLVEHFLQELEQRWGRNVGRPTPAGLRELLSYEWPGNVRELQNVIERAALMSDGRGLEGFGGLSSAPTSERMPPKAVAADADVESLEAVERRHILTALERCRWRIGGERGAGAALGLHPNTLRYRMKKLGIDRSDP
jgi:transcriptional regulator with GAF, ATPase, and Fis domain